jgi:hypothetical protein
VPRLPARSATAITDFFSGQLISLVGTWMQTVAESWLVYRLTGSAALLRVAGFASQIRCFSRHDRRHRRGSLTATGS